MNIKRVVPAVILAAALIPALLVAQTPEEQVQSALDQATEAGIPTSLLESKIREGQAKGIAMDRIADAVQRRLDGLARAQDALAGIPDVSSSDLDAGVEALESGVSEAVLAELAETSPGDSRTAAIAALSYLVDEDIVPEQALTQVQDALARGPDALENLPDQARGPADVGAPGEAGQIPGPADIATEVGPPAGVPAPGEAPAGARPGGAEPPSGLPGSGGAPSDLPGSGAF